MYIFNCIKVLSYRKWLKSLNAMVKVTIFWVTKEWVNLFSGNPHYGYFYHCKIGTLTSSIGYINSVGGLKSSGLIQSITQMG